MTDTNIYRNVSLKHETYTSGHLLSTEMFDGLKVSMSQLIESLIALKIKELKLESKLENYKQPPKIFPKRKKRKSNGKNKKV